ncbi:MAG: low molecular weight protein-tyrosine-phosphatase [Anaerolineae bacterium]
MIRVLMLCMGNICRSPMAEAVFRDMVERAGLADKISVDSAGTSGYHAGELAHPRTLQVLERHGIYYSGTSRRVRAEDFVKFDYILAMDRYNLRQIDHFIETSRAKVTLLLSYAYHAGLMTFDEVEDPYYNDRYEDTYEVIRVGCKAFLDYLRERYRL